MDHFLLNLKLEDVQLFYYFIKSESNPESDPLIICITGCPGCSALSGLIYEIGPITFEAAEYNGSLPTMILNPYSWTKVASIIFLDLPVGTGFSYTRTPAALQSSDLQASDQAYQFLHKWFVDHPEILRNPLYVGDSYSGMVVSIITQIIGIKNEMGIKPSFNLKGYLLGNPSTFEGENNYEIPYAYGMGLISDELYESLKTNCKGEYLDINPSNTLCLQDVQTFKESKNYNFFLWRDKEEIDQRSKFILPRLVNEIKELEQELVKRQVNIIEQVVESDNLKLDRRFNRRSKWCWLNWKIILCILVYAVAMFICNLLQSGDDSSIELIELL